MSLIIATFVVLVSFIITASTLEKFTVENLLGGHELIGHRIDSEMDRYVLSKKGLPKKSLLNLSQQLNIPVKAIASLLHLNERTIQRKDDLDLLDELTSAQLLQIAEVYTCGMEVFQDADNFHVWMNSNSTALGHQKPIALLSSSYGVQMVLDELGRIEYGIFA